MIIVIIATIAVSHTDLQLGRYLKKPITTGLLINKP